MIGKLRGNAGRWLGIVPAGVLCWFAAGCDTPPDIQLIAPPGTQIQRKDPAPEAAEALGEMPTSGRVPTEVSNSAPKPAALPTAKGETKTTAGGVKYETLKEGTGPEFASGQTGAFLYEGKLADGTVFDSTKTDGKPRSFKIGAGSVIDGWQEGLPGMKVGEVRKLTIPPEMGYGARGFGKTIPANATLIFEVELTGIAGK